MDSRCHLVVNCFGNNGRTLVEWGGVGLVTSSVDTPVIASGCLIVVLLLVVLF